MNDKFPKPLIGISRCLLGDEVRFDGGHKRDAFAVETLAAHVDWMPVCPEVEVGMGTPREAIRLVKSAGGVPSGSERVALVGVRSGFDWSAGMEAWSRRRVAAMAKLPLAGYILKKDSPSCGMERVRVYHEGGATRSGRGLFAEALLTALPDLPVEEEGRLHDPRLRENFIERVFAYGRLRECFTGRWTVGGLVRFHTAHKLQLLAHSRVRYTELGRLVAGASTSDRTVLARDYRHVFMTALRTIATPGRHADVMMHMLGHLKQQLDASSRQEILELIDEHRRGVVPLVVPLTLLRHHVRQHDVEYLKGQVYLDPHPRELALRNRV